MIAVIRHVALSNAVVVSAVDPAKERVLVSFKEAGVMDRFQVTTDQVLGGATAATLELKQVGNLRYGASSMAGRRPHLL